MVSTGLPYLIVPVRAEELAAAEIRVPDFEALLAECGAKFVYVLDPVALEGRTWDNAGRVEDVATGSAAGPAAAYLIHLGIPSERFSGADCARPFHRPAEHHRGPTGTVRWPLLGRRTGGPGRRWPVPSPQSPALGGPRSRTAP